MRVVMTYPVGVVHAHDLRRAWTWLAAYPFVLAAGIVSGEWLVSALGYDVGGDVPFGVAALVGVPISLLIVVPAYFALRFGWRANREGDSRGLIPAILGAAAILQVVGPGLLTLVGLALGL